MRKKPWKSSAGLVRRLLKDPEVRIYFEIEKARSEFAAAVRGARRKAGFTQAALAGRIGTTQSVISRLESGNDKRTPSLPLLAKIAQACHGHLEVRFRFSKAA
ncbi:MAG: helix-turn-helix transcriptional regulator [Pseudomonadota bacterium]